MPGWGRDRWRLAIVVAAIGATVVAVIVVWAVQGREAAVDLAAILSVVNVLGALAAWVRGSAERTLSERVDLAGVLRDLAEAHSVSRAKVRDALGERSADTLLDGTSFPKWDVIAAFLAVVAHDNQGVRDGLERLVRPVWESAGRQEASAAGGGATATIMVQVTTEAGVLLAISQRAAEASRVAGLLQESVNNLQSWRNGLSFALGKHASGISSNTAQQDQARQQESLRQHLDETERLLQTAKARRDDAVAQATRFRQDLARIEHSLIPAPPALTVSAADDPYRRLGEEASDLTGDDVIRRTDVFLGEQNAELQQYADTLSRLEKASSRSQPRRLRIPVAAAASLVAVAALASFLAIHFSHGGSRAHAGGTSSATPSLTGRPVTPKPSSDIPPSAHPPSVSPSPAKTWPAPLPTPQYLDALTAPGSKGGVESVAFSPDGTILAVGDRTGRTYLWSLARHRIIATLTDPGSIRVISVSFSPDGTTLAAGDLNGHTYLWSLATHKITATLTIPGRQGVYSVAFSPDGTTLAAGDVNDSTYLFSMATRKITATLTDRSGGGVDSVAFSPDGATLAVGDVNDSTYLFSMATRKITATLTADPKGHQAFFVAFSPDGATLAVGDLNVHTYLFSMATRKNTALTDPSGAGVFSVAFSPDGATLVTGDRNGHAYLFSMATRKITATLTDPHSSGVSSVAFSPDDTTLAIGDDNASTYLWRVAGSAS